MLFSGEIKKQRYEFNGSQKISILFISPEKKFALRIMKTKNTIEITTSEGFFFIFIHLTVVNMLDDSFSCFFFSIFWPLAFPSFFKWIDIGDLVNRKSVEKIFQFYIQIWSKKTFWFIWTWFWWWQIYSWTKKSRIFRKQTFKW